MSKRRSVAVALVIAGLMSGQAHAGIFDAFKSRDRLRRESMARGLNYQQASRAAYLVQYSTSGVVSGMTSLQREALKNGASWLQARRIR